MKAVEIREEDVEVHEFMRDPFSEGSPGMLALHVPSGIAAYCQDYDSQSANLQKAVLKLRVAITAVADLHDACGGAS